jgi:murein DD-endopeptidase MepM/ murein hydrolase activator NlpD
MRSSLICLISLIPLSVAAEPTICGTLQQGEPIRGQTNATDRLTLDGKPLFIDRDGSFLFAIDRNRTKPLVLEKTDSEQNVERYILPVAATRWQEQHVNGVAQKHVSPSKEDEPRILTEQADVGKALSRQNNNIVSWKDVFAVPVKGKISGHFGNRRVFNGVPKNPHTGTDIAAPEGTPVKAAADGVVVLSGGPYFYSGNIVILDHGNDLKTIYMHLKDFSVSVGERVAKGQTLGLVGHTGRATGPHLHWGASIGNVRVRPHALAAQSQDCRPLTNFREPSSWILHN